MFAKLFETEKGQILVKFDDGDCGPEVRFFFRPEGLGVCSIALSWEKDDIGTAWDKAGSIFNKADLEYAKLIVFPQIEKIENAIADGGD